MRAIPWIRRRRAAEAALAFLLLFAAPLAAETGGHLLVAAPSMPDPRFRETVIVMVKHDAAGAFGVVINRPVLRAPLAEVMKGLGVEAKDAEGEITVYGGGPVEPDAAFVLHSTDYADKATVTVTQHIAITSSGEILSAIAAGKGPARCILIFGYSGWGPMQLDGEMAQEGWVVAPADPAIVFDDSHSTKWRRAIARRGIDL